ncbi:MAG: hypothetical protein VZQ47_05580 [Treponema sp.]|nr:hypothetical protein [Treponema sp.]MEE3435005.1 hypothetical protein [Treponema sp.]
MKSIKLLDCTLRDGGYINDWKFGNEAIHDISNKLVNSGIDIVELGFLKNEQEDENRTVYNSTKQLIPLIGKKKPDTLYAAMIDVQGRIPIEMVEPRTDETVDIIRVIVWKRLLQEDYEYCKQIVEKGYKLCVQPARVDQYSDDEFVSMIHQFEDLNPLAIYVVDSWGTLSIDDFLHYYYLIERELNENIAIGYHGHNNMQQAFGIAETLLRQNSKHNLIIDASVYGIGRGAGNLNTEIISNFLNLKFQGKYVIDNYVYIYEKYIKKIYEEFKWGFSIPLFITAMEKCNPEYGLFCQKNNVSETEIIQILNQLKGDDRIRFNKTLINELTSKNTK